MKVVLFQRHVAGGYSVENIATNLVRNLPLEAQVEVFKSTYFTQGIINRIRYSWQAMQYQGDVNHILGDIHFLSVFLNKRKTILTILDCTRLMNSDLGLVRKQFYKFIWFTLPKYFCRYIVTISEESKNNLVRYAGLDKDRITVIHVGIDNQFKKLNLTNQEKESLLANKEDKKSVLHISTPQSQKNVPRLIKAIGPLSVKFIKVGEFTGEECRLLKEYHIDYYQYKSISLEQLVKIYNAVDCLVFPSLIEGFGMPVIEAQKCGCPVVTSNISSLPEVAGGGAILVDPYSIDSITEGINKVLFDQELKMVVIRKGFENAQRFEWSKIALEHYVYYQKVMGNNLSCIRK